MTQRIFGTDGVRGLANGDITAEHAREAYGVVLKPADDGFAWALDAAATEALRSSMRG